MALEYEGNIMERLKVAGWSEYMIRKEKRLSAATIKSLKTGDTHISLQTLDRICEMLGGVQPNDVIWYTKTKKEERGIIVDIDEKLYIALSDEYDALKNPTMLRSEYIMKRYNEINGEE